MIQVHLDLTKTSQAKTHCKTKMTLNNWKFTKRNCFSKNKSSDKTCFNNLKEKEKK